MSFSLHRCVLLFVSSLALASAVPTPAELAPRSCSTIAPPVISKLDKSAPDTASVGRFFALHRDGGPNSNTVRSVVSFIDIPAGATGCMLQIDLPRLPNEANPAGYPFASGTGTQSDVWLISNPPRDNPDDAGFVNEYTWNNPPARNQFVSTTIFPPGSPTEPYRTFLWSGTCKRTLSFEFVLSDWQQGSGDVSFYDSLGGRSGKYVIPPIGFSMVYNC